MRIHISCKYKINSNEKKRKADDLINDFFENSRMKELMKQLKIKRAFK